MGGRELILWSVRLGLACYAVSCYRYLQRDSADPRRYETSSAMRNDRLWWSVTGLILWVHFAAAFHFHHHWSHQHAFTHTAQRTGDMLGWEFGYGVYFNYLFLLLWAVDVCWWLFSPAGYLHRRRWISVSIQVFFLFVVINGAIVFVRYDLAITWSDCFCLIPSDDNLERMLLSDALHAISEIICTI